VGSSDPKQQIREALLFYSGNASPDGGYAALEALAVLDSATVLTAEQTERVKRAIERRIEDDDALEDGFCDCVFCVEDREMLAEVFAVRPAAAEETTNG
jgi:hypothetical protein